MTRADSLIQELIEIVGTRGVLYRKEDLLAYECDAYTIHRGMPRAVVFPATTEEVAGVVKHLHKQRIPFLPRGAGTGLSGGAIPIGGEVIISLVRMKKLLHVDLENRLAFVQPGFVNLKLTHSISD